MVYENSKFADSVILIDKCLGRTSSDTINDLRKVINIRKLGHSGTLDKFASGLLIVCTGWATKLTTYFLNGEKRYIGTIKLGVATDTCDPEGKIIENRDVKGVNSDSIGRIKERFSGDIMQMPPAFSALKIKGRRASDLTREGKEISLKERLVNIRKLDILKIDLDNSKITIDVTCSKGTYIRSLARDIGEFLGTVAYLDELRRVSSGNFNIDNAVTTDELKNAESTAVNKNFLIKPEEALKDFSCIKVSNTSRKNILNGGFFKEDDMMYIKKKESDSYIILDEEENLIAIANVDIDNWSINYLNVFNRNY